MSDFDFYSLAADNLGTLVAFLLGFTLVATMVAWGLTGRLVDPLVVYVGSTFGPSWGVVAFLVAEGYVSSEAQWLVFGSVSLLFASMALAIAVHQQNRSNTEGRLHFFAHPARLIVLALGLSVAMLLMVGNLVAVESRFESIRGLGFFVRLLDPCRLLLAGYVGWRIANGASRSELAGWAILLLMLCVTTGARFSIVETGLATAVGARVSERPGTARRDQQGLVGRLITLFGFVLITVALASVMTNAAFEARGGDSDARTTFFPELPLTAELLLLRILANGDMYFFSLPNDLIFRIVDIRNPVAQFFGPLLGDTAMRKLFDYPLGNLEVGRQIWLHWYARDAITRGSTSHFELVAWSYFGWVGGAMFIMGLGVFVGRLIVCARTMKTSNPLLAAFFGALYIRSMTALLSPALALAFIVDLLLVAAVFGGRADAGLRCLVAVLR